MKKYSAPILFFLLKGFSTCSSLGMDTIASYNSPLLHPFPDQQLLQCIQKVSLQCCWLDTKEIEAPLCRQVMTCSASNVSGILYTCDKHAERKRAFLFPIQFFSPYIFQDSGANTPLQFKEKLNKLEEKMQAYLAATVMKSDDEINKILGQIQCPALGCTANLDYIFSLHTFHFTCPKSIIHTDLCHFNPSDPRFDRFDILFGSILKAEYPKGKAQQASKVSLKVFITNLIKAKVKKKVEEIKKNKQNILKEICKNPIFTQEDRQQIQNNLDVLEQVYTQNKRTHITIHSWNEGFNAANSKEMPEQGASSYDSEAVSIHLNLKIEENMDTGFLQAASTTAHQAQPTQETFVKQEER